MATTSGANPESGLTPSSPTTPTSGTTPPTGTMPPALPIALKVSFTLNTPDRLREISFGLEKDTDGTQVNWTITFVLYERTDTTTSFGDPIVSLNVFVASTLHANAETAAHNGLTPVQTAHATGPAADAAKAVQAGTMPLPVGNKIIQNSLK
jgi:hypothetical protein